MHCDESEQAAFRRPAGLLSLIVLVTIGAAAAANDWPATFGTGEVSRLPLSNGGVLVVAAGADPVQSRSAADALIAALQTAQRFGVIMNDQAIGDVSGLDDAQIFERCRPYPVAAVAIVRVFPAAVAGGPEQAVMVFYDKSGNVATAVNALEGTPLVIEAGGAQAGQGVSSEAAAAVSDITKTTEIDVQAAIEQYEQRMVWFEHWIGISGDTGAVVATWSVPYEGKFKKPLRHWRFYDLVGRPDLVDRYKTRLGLKVGLGVGGGLMFVGGMGLVMYGLLSETGECVDRYDGECMEWINKPALGVGIGLAVVGTAGMMIGIFMSAHPVGEPERLRLADEYNQRLRQELGLTDEVLRSYLKLSTFSEVRFSPLAMPGGGALGLSGKFNLELR